jgi:hypothetical protein
VAEVKNNLIQREVLLKGKKPVNLIWRELTLIFNDKIVNGLILENFLYGENSLKAEEIQALYVDFCKRNGRLDRKSEEFKQALINDDYINFLAIKFGYAITGHKAQGGEWDNVFSIWDHDITPGFNCYLDLQRKAGKTNQDFYSWAYTAITRASKTLYALNPPFFHSYSSMTIIEPTVQTGIIHLVGTSQEIEEIQLDEEILRQLTNLKLLDQPLQIQDHFINTNQAVLKHGFETIGWEKLGYEIRYVFSKEGRKTSFKTFINSRNEFRNPFTPLPNPITIQDDIDSLNSIINNLSKISVKRNTSETILTQLEFDLEVEEKLPFTKTLFDDVSRLLTGTDLIIEEVLHLPYRERYVFLKKHEKSVFDFIYNNNGFWGRVEPVRNHSNSTDLFSEIASIISKLKIEDNANK